MIFHVTLQCLVNITNVSLEISQKNYNMNNEKKNFFRYYKTDLHNSFSGTVKSRKKSLVWIFPVDTSTKPLAYWALWHRWMAHSRGVLETTNLKTSYKLPWNLIKGGDLLGSFHREHGSLLPRNLLKRNLSKNAFLTNSQ